MSQTKNVLKNIASSNEYKNLEEAVTKVDYGAMASGYLEVSKLIEAAEKDIEQKIQGLTRQNKTEDYKQFKSAFNSRAQEALPKWHWLNSELLKQNIMEGTVFGVGTKGDPMVRTPEGRIVIISGATLKEGDRVKFRVVTEGQKVHFGQVFDFNAESFNSILNQESRKAVFDSFNSVRDRIESRPADAGDYTLLELSSILKELEEVKEKASKLQPEEKDKVVARVMAYRRRLLTASTIKMVFDLISREEELRIKDALSDRDIQSPVHGLFCQKSYQELKNFLFSGKELRGVSEAVGKLENNIETMDAALKYLDFQEGIEKIQSPSKKYFEKMDRFFDRLQNKARQFSFTLAEDKICESEQIQSAISSAFSEQNLSSELSFCFQSPDDFFSMREAIQDLRVKIGDTAVNRIEISIKPYLQEKIKQAFEEKGT